MTRLPFPGADSGDWGSILNEYLSIAHQADGSLKPIDQSTVINLSTSLASKYVKPSTGIASTDLDAASQDSLAKADAALPAAVAESDYLKKTDAYAVDPASNMRDQIDPRRIALSWRGARTAAQLGYTDYGPVASIAGGGRIPTDIHQEIRGLTKFDGRYFMAHGDWSANTGPIHIMTYDPATNAYADEATVITQAIDHFVVAGGCLFAIAADTVGAATEIAWRRSAGSTSWTACYAPAGFIPEHVGFIAEYSGALYASIQPLNTPTTRGFGLIARSVDSGLTWQDFFHIPSEPINPAYVASTFHRVSSLWVQGGKLMTQQADYNIGSLNLLQPHTWVYDGTSWQKGPALLPAYYQRRDNVLGVNGQNPQPPMIYKGTTGTWSEIAFFKTHYSQPSDFWAFDGVSSRLLLEGIVGEPVVTGFGNLYVMDEFGLIYWLDGDIATGGRFQPITRAPHNARSFATEHTSGTAIVVGTADGHIVRAQLNSAAAWDSTVAPFA